MRISIDPTDAGYCSLAGINRPLMVLLDGDPVRSVVTADEEEGFVIVAVLTDMGQPMNLCGVQFFETRHGQVRILDMKCSRE